MASLIHDELLSDEATSQQDWTDAAPQNARASRRFILAGAIAMVVGVLSGGAMLGYSQGQKSIMTKDLGVSIHLYGGTAPRGSECSFPFTYQEQTFDECTDLDVTPESPGRSWCSVADENGGDTTWWAYCHDGAVPTVYTVNDKLCALPFMWEGVKYTDCTLTGSADSSKSWCFLKGGQTDWEYCRDFVVGGIMVVPTIVGGAGGVGPAWTHDDGVGPAWTYDDSVEAPEDEEDRGGWIARVYSEEQMKRLGVDKEGSKVVSLIMGGAGGVGPAWTYDDSVEPPEDEEDRGGWIARVYSEEQMKRMGVDKEGNKVDSVVEKPMAIAGRQPIVWADAEPQAITGRQPIVWAQPFIVEDKVGPMIMIGGGRDKHGCIIGTGYQWCPKTEGGKEGECLRSCAPPQPLPELPEVFIEEVGEPVVVTPPEASQLKMCCRGLTAQCLACGAEQTIFEYCVEHPKTAGCKKVCCRGLTAQCLACGAEQTIKEYCVEKPETVGCKKNCCRGLKAQCLACDADMTIEEYCVEKPETAGCKKRCCRGLTAKCLACDADMTIEEYCVEKPETAGCKKKCCRAFTATCLACDADMTIEEYCVEKPETAGCETEETKEVLILGETIFVDAKQRGSFETPFNTLPQGV